METSELLIWTASTLLLLSYGRLIWHWRNTWPAPSHPQTSPLKPQPSTLPPPPSNLNPPLLIPLRNESDRITPLLDVLAGQGKPAIWLIDDHSEDGTAEVIARWATTHPEVEVHLLTSHGTGKKAAIRTGMNALPGTVDHVLLTDADARPGPGWLAAWGAAIAAHPQVALHLGEVRIGPGAGVRGGVERVEFAAMMGWAAATARMGKPANASGANLCVRRGDWLAADLREDVASGDDVFLAQHLAAAGRPVVWCAAEGTKIEVAPTANWSELLQQRARWGRKSNRYPDWRAQAVAGIIVATNLWMIAAAATSLWPLAIGKVVLDGWLTQRLQGPRWRVKDWLAFSLLYPVVVVGSLGLAYLMPGKMQWKARPLQQRNR